MVGCGSATHPQRHVSVLSRYSLRTEDDSPALGTLVVMEIDCDQTLTATFKRMGCPGFALSGKHPPMMI